MLGPLIVPLPITWSHVKPTSAYDTRAAYEIAYFPTICSRRKQNKNKKMSEFNTHKSVPG